MNVTVQQIDQSLKTEHKVDSVKKKKTKKSALQFVIRSFEKSRKPDFHLIDGWIVTHI